MYETQEGRMTLQERCDLVLAFARVLSINGQATEQTKSARAPRPGAVFARYAYATLGGDT
jgi:hypothetical protein